MTASEWRNKLYYGDNLVWLRDKDHFPNESVDLIYLDPPFNSNADYNVIFKEPGGEKSQAQIRVFGDSWDWDRAASEEALRDLGGPWGKPELVELIHWIAGRGHTASKSMAAYLSMMAVRLVELHRVLKPTGSLYLHCDPTASHYLKLVLDQVFGVTNFRNEIVWCYAGGGIPKKDFPRKHDIIFRYRKTKDYLFNAQYRPYSEGTIQRGRTKVKGKYAEKGLRLEGTPVNDWWTDIHPIHSPTDYENLGYPTQKPLALLDRIIKASSNEGYIVLDPFCGCGTSVVAAQKLNRRWIGIDVTWFAVDLIERRLRESYGDGVKNTYVVYGKPYDESSAGALAAKSKKEFEIWAISLVGAAPRERDGGVDGLLSILEAKDKSTKVIVQVKGGTTLYPGMVRDLIGTVEKESAAIGLLITLGEPTSGMRELAVHAGSYTSPVWGKSYPRIQIRTVSELLEGKGFDLPYGETPMKKATPIRERGRTGRML